MIERERLLRRYEKIAKIYDLLTLVSTLGLDRFLRRKAIDKLELKQGDLALDFACGTGLNFPILEERVGREGRIIGVDLSEAQLKQAESKVKRCGWDNVELHCKDAVRFEPNQAVDGVVITYGVNVIPNYLTALRHLPKVVKSEGRLSILDVKLVEKWYGRLLNPLARQVCSIFYNYPRYETVKSGLQAIFKDVGIEEHLFGSVYVCWGVNKSGL